MARMFTLSVVVVLAAALQAGFLEASTREDTTYVAGVVEFEPVLGSSGKPNLLWGVLPEFQKILESKEAEPVDIIVFPEHVLAHPDHTYVPEPEENVVPCETLAFQGHLSELSCMARGAKKYMLVNLNEMVDCTPAGQAANNDSRPCSPDGVTRYNTNVVFDRRGAVVSKYRKAHLWGPEVYFVNRTKTPEISTFETDFGVTFAHFICFDILFYSPAQAAVDQGIKNILYPTYWFSELPFMTAIQLQQSWAYANDVNFLASGGSKPSSQNTGSGIFSGKQGSLVSIMAETPTTKLLVATVPKIPVGTLPPIPSAPFTVQPYTRRMTGLTLFRDFDIDLYTTEVLDNVATKIEKRICHADVCCDFSVQRAQTPSNAINRDAFYQYRLAAYSGKATFQRKEKSFIRTCAVFACTSQNLMSCGRIFPAGVTVENAWYFETLKISAKFPKAGHMVVMPTTVDGMMEPLAVDQFSYLATDTSNSTSVEFALTRPKMDLLTFGLYANYYSEEQSMYNMREVDRSSVGRLSAALGTVVMVFIANIFC